MGNKTYFTCTKLKAVLTVEACSSRRDNAFRHATCYKCADAVEQQKNLACSSCVVEEATASLSVSPPKGRMLKVSDADRDQVYRNSRRDRIT